MKYIPIIVFLFSSIVLSGQWSKTNGPFGGNISQVVNSEDKVWAISNSTIYLSLDQGENWLDTDIIPKYLSARSFTIIEDVIYFIAYYHPNSDYENTYKDRVFLYESHNNGDSWDIHLVGDFGFDVRFNPPDKIVKIGDEILILNHRGIIDPYKGESRAYIEGNSTNHYRFGASNEKMYLSMGDHLLISLDGGSIWKKRGNFDEVISHVYIDDDVLLVVDRTEEIFISTDIGNTFTSMGHQISYFADGFNFKKVDDKIYAIPEMMYLDRSTLKWIASETELPNTIRFRVHDVILEGDQWIFACENGIQVSDYDFENVHTSNHGITAMDVYELYVSPKNYLFANTSIGEFASFDGGDNWTYVDLTHRCDGVSHIFWNNEEAIIHSNNNVFSSIDRFDTIDTLYSHSHRNKFGAQQLGSEAIYFDTDSIYVSMDYGKYWSSVHLEEYGGILLGEKSIYLNTSSFYHGVYESKDFGVSWDSICYRAKQIFEFNDELVISISEDNWVSRNDVNEWTTFNPIGLPIDTTSHHEFLHEILIPRTKLVIDNFSIGSIMNDGVYITYDAAKTWVSFNEGLDNLRIKHIHNSEDNLYLTSIDGGIFKRELETTGIDDFTSSELFAMYPNPVSSVLNLDFEQSNFDRVEIFDIAGNLVESSQTLNRNHMQFDVSDMKSGVYIVRLSSNNHISTKKMIVCH